MFARVDGKPLRLPCAPECVGRVVERFLEDDVDLGLVQRKRSELFELLFGQSGPKISYF